MPQQVPLNQLRNPSDTPSIEPSVELVCPYDVPTKPVSYAGFIDETV